MRPIDTSLKAALAAKEIRPFILLEMYLDDSTRRYTDCDIPLVVDGYMYYPRHFEPASSKYSLGTIVGTLELLIDDLDSALSSEFLGGNPQDCEVTIKMIALDSNYVQIGSDPFVIFDGAIDKWTKKEDIINIMLVNVLFKWNKRILSLHPPSCRWKVFKGVECQYTGVELTCNRSYAQCLRFNNTAHFGGFRWLPSIISKEIIWGGLK